MTMLKFEIDNSESQIFLAAKRLAYLFYLLVLPLNLRYTWAIFLFGALLSLLDRAKILRNPRREVFKKGNKDIDFVNYFLDEELVNIFFLVFLLPSGTIFKFLINASLSLWALMHAADWADDLLIQDEDTIVLATLQPLI